MMKMLQSLQGVFNGSWVPHPERLTRYGDQPTTHDVVKVIATLAMICDHLGMYFFPEYSVLRVFGRVAAPLFFFLIGAASGHRFKWSLVFFGILLTGLYYAVWGQVYINILLNFVFIKWFFQRLERKTLSTRQLIIIFIALAIFTICCHHYIEYAGLGLMFALCGYTRSDKQAPIFLMGTISFYFLIEAVDFARVFTLGDLTLLSCLMTLLCIGLLYFKKRVWQIPKAPGFLIVSRYSLAVYVGHIVFIVLFKYCILHH